MNTKHAKIMRIRREVAHTARYMKVKHIELIRREYYADLASLEFKNLANLIALVKLRMIGLRRSEIIKFFDHS